jgi:hypothetical protein
MVPGNRFTDYSPFSPQHSFVVGEGDDTAQQQEEGA